MLQDYSQSFCNSNYLVSFILFIIRTISNTKVLSIKNNYESNKIFLTLLKKSEEGSYFILNPFHGCNLSFGTLLSSLQNKINSIKILKNYKSYRTSHFETFFILKKPFVSFKVIFPYLSKPLSHDDSYSKNNFFFFKNKAVSKSEIFRILGFYKS